MLECEHEGMQLGQKMLVDCSPLNVSRMRNAFGCPSKVGIDMVEQFF